VRHPAVIAHRGLGGGGRENTLEAFRASTRLGIDGVELDVHRTGDGTLVVHHDADVDGVVIATATLTEVVDAGWRLGYEIPTLADVLDVVPTDILLDVELKATGHEAQALAQVSVARPPGTWAFTSFHSSTVATLRALDPGASLGLLVGNPAPSHGLATYLGELVDAPRRARRAQASLLAPNWRFVATRPLRALHLRGTAEAWVWTVNEPALIERLLRDPRVAAVITDQPAEALAIREDVAREDEGLAAA
jgi:glycerophosphoryl diester phosphodiesterase